MPSVLDLPYDVLREIFIRLSAVDVLYFLCTSRKLYYPLIDDDSTWYNFCAPYGITNTSMFRNRSFRIIYGRLLHRYGPLLGLWCSDYPFHGNVVEFRLVPDRWLRRGEPIIVGDVWEFSGKSTTATNRRPIYPRYIEFMQVGFLPWKKSTFKTTNDVHVSWHIRSERALGFLVHNGIPPPWVRMDGDGRLATPSLHVIAPSSMTIDLGNSYTQPVTEPEMVNSVPWYDSNRGLPRLIPEGPPPIIERKDRWLYRPTNVRYIEGELKPASIAFFPPPHDKESDVRLPELHNPPHYISRDYQDLIPRYYPMLFPAPQSIDAASDEWTPSSVVGIWLGDYGPHGTECLFLQHHTQASESVLRAWKITGDIGVPRGACSWEANLQRPIADGGLRRRAFEGNGTLAQSALM
ncbi:hypothetical protein C2E23DRAFT_841840 [Lenzites betulinus]|nr:hypothetical protein C2E23DRAFT_841840 [Lenzites betulinus]